MRQIDEGLILTTELVLECRYGTLAGGIFWGTGLCHAPVVTFVRPRIGRKSRVLSPLETQSPSKSTTNALGRADAGVAREPAAASGCHNDDSSRIPIVR